MGRPRFGRRLPLVAIAFAALATALAPPSHAAPPNDALFRAQVWQTEDGLPESSATAMVQTADGYLWFGTFDGLVRFDGVRFVVLDSTNTPALPTSSIINLHLDRVGRLWVSTSGGLAVREGDAWRTIGAADGWRGDAVRSIAEGPSGDLLFTTFDGAVQRFANGRFTPMSPHETRKGPIVACDGAGRWWLMQLGLLATWDGSGWARITSVKDDEAETAVCAPARDGGVWVVARRSVLKYRSPSEMVRTTLAEDLHGLWSAFEDSSGDLWVCTHDNGLFRIAPDGALLHWSTANTLASNGVRFVFEDREGNLWVGTSGGGLMRLTRIRCRTFGVESGIPEPLVNSVCPDREGGVLVGTYGRGYFRLAEGVVTHMPLGPGGGYVQSVLVDRRGRTWVGTYGDGLFLVDRSGTRHFAGDATGGANVLALFEDSSGRVWISGGAAIASMSGDTTRVYGEAEGLPRSEVCSFTEDDQGRIWLSNLGGVYRLEGERFSEVMDGEGHSITQVSCFAGDGDGTMWMGSRRAGLLRWRAGHLDRLSERTDAIGRAVLGIVKDDRGFWWFSTNRGIARAAADEIAAVIDGRRAQLRVQRVGLLDGLATLECTDDRQPVSARDSRGRLWFATRRGVAMIDPATFRQNDLPPPVAIEEIGYVANDSTSAGDRLVPPTLLPVRGEALRIPPGAQRVTIRYAALSYADPSAVRFQVMMEGVDGAWRDVGAERLAVYGNLSPGAHRFRVRAANNDGVWNEIGASATLEVAPFLWQTWWFQALAAFALVGSGGAAASWIAQVREGRRQRAENRFRLALEASSSGMVMFDASGRIVLVNAQMERSFGYARTDLIGQPIEALVPACRSRLADDLSERVGVRRDGSEFPIEIGFSPIDTDAGRFVLASISDISHRQRVELEMARQRNEVAHLSRVNMLGELSGSIAHELNQPLTAILSNAQAAQRFMRRDPVDLAEVREILDDIVQQNKRAGEVIHRLRALLRKGEVSHETLSAGEIVREVLKLARSDLINHGVNFDAELPDDLPPVRGDRIQIQQVLLNLVMNACDVMEGIEPEERMLVVSVAPHAPGHLRVTVRDSGTGIPPGQLEQIFTPFFTTKGKGMGLGLAVCRTIVTSHAGEIWATNNPDRGASIHFTLPVSTEPIEGEAE